MLKVIFAGTPEFAVPALEKLVRSEHQLVAVYTQPDRKAGRGRHLRQSPIKECALADDIPVFQPHDFKDTSTLTQLGNLHADVMVVAAYGLLLPSQLIKMPRFGCINIHASLLPRWRGAAPIQQAILSGDAESGITIMQMDEGLDTGDILKQACVSIAPDWTALELHDCLKMLGADFLMTVLHQLTSGDAQAYPQDDRLACYAARLSKHQARIDWNKSAYILAREIRAYVPWPVSFTHLDGQPVRIWRACASEQMVDAEPGKILCHDRNSVSVCCQNSTLIITELQFAGKNRSSAAEALNARNLNGKYFA